MEADVRDVVVTGIGVVTSAGSGTESLWSSLCDRRAEVSSRTLPVEPGRTVDLPIVSMQSPDELEDCKDAASFLASQDCGDYRDLAYTISAIKHAIGDAGLEYDSDNNDIGVIQAFEAPGVERAVTRLFELFTSAPSPDAAPPPLYDALSRCFYNMQPFLYVHLISKALGLHGFSTSVHNACSSGAFALEAAAERIRSGQADVMIVAGGEAFDTGVRLEWFRNLDLYARDQRMAPFDTEPTGFYVGEGGGALVLESRAHAERRNASPYATYLGGAFAQQGWKQTIPDVRAGRLTGVITKALNRARVEPNELDLIVPHGAASALSDGYENACLSKAIGGQASRAVATVFKPQLGHLLAASGIVEFVCALLALRHQCVPPAMHTCSGTAKFPVPIAQEPIDRPITTILKLSTGFTGHDAASLFRRY